MRLILCCNSTNELGVFVVHRSTKIKITRKLIGSIKLSPSLSLFEQSAKEALHFLFELLLAALLYCYGFN